MTKGTYGGGTIGLPWGGGFGLYFDNFGRAYPQLYGGSPGWGLSAGYTPNLEGLLTGSSISASVGRGPIRGNAGMSGDSFGAGLGTPGVGVTHGFGPYEMSQDFSRPLTKPHILDSVRSAGVPSRNTVWEYDYLSPSSSGSPSAANESSRTVFKKGASPVLLPSVPRGLPGLMAETGAVGPDGAPPAGGLVGLIQDYIRNNPDGTARP